MFLSPFLGASALCEAGSVGEASGETFDKEFDEEFSACARN